MVEIVGDPLPLALDRTLEDYRTAGAFAGVDAFSTDLRSADLYGRADPLLGAPSLAPLTPNITARDANERYGIPGPAGLKFDTDLPEEVAKSMHDARQEAIARNDANARRATDVWSQAAHLGAQFLVGALDPVNIAASFVPGVGEARMATWLGLSRAFTPEAIASGAYVAQRAGVRALAGATAGAAGQAALEPLQILIARSEGEDYHAVNTLLDLAFGTVLGGGLHPVAGAAGDWLGRRFARSYAGDAAATLETREAALGTALAQMADGRPVEVRPVFDASLRQDLAEGTALGHAADLPAQVVADEPALRPPSPAAETAPAAAPGEAPVAAALPAAGTAPPAAEAVSAPSAAAGTTFRTAKGSTYEIHEDGTTTRNKAYRPEHGEAEQGPQRRSEATFYVTPEEANKLGEIQNNGPRRAISPLSDGRWGITYLEGPSVGKWERRTVVTPSLKPAVGLMPVELWKGGERVHFGNAITEVTRPPPPAPEQQAAALEGPRFRLSAEPAEPAANLPSWHFSTDAQNRPLSLADFIARNGGVQDPGGDLRSQDLHLWHLQQPFRGRLLNPRGMLPDQARELAEQFHYVPAGETIDDFNQALIADAQGQPTFSAKDQTAAGVARERRQATREKDPAYREHQAQRMEDELRHQAQALGIAHEGRDLEDVAFDVEERRAIMAEGAGGDPGAARDEIERDIDALVAYAHDDIPFEVIDDARGETGPEPAPLEAAAGRGGGPDARPGEAPEARPAGADAGLGRDIGPEGDRGRLALDEIQTARLDAARRAAADPHSLPDLPPLEAPPIGGGEGKLPPALEREIAALEDDLRRGQAAGDLPAEDPELAAAQALGDAAEAQARAYEQGAACLARNT